MSVIDFTEFKERAVVIARSLFDLPEARQYPYHNLHHTENVVKHTSFLAGHYQLDERASALLAIAAWFHDTGHLFGPPEGHEAKSAEIMMDKLSFLEAPYNSLNEIAEIICATRVGSKPANLSQEIICDADTWHFGTTDFHRTEFLVQEEMELRTHRKFADWLDKSIKLLDQHRFYTTYCTYHLNAGKQENMQWLLAQKH